MKIAERFDAFLLDLDGTVWEGGDALPYAVESINDSGVPCAYITNNASRSPDEVGAMLAAIGLDGRPDRILTSAQVAVEMVRDVQPNARRVLVLGTQSFRALAADAGLEVVDSADDRPDVVLHGHSPQTGWEELSEAALSIRQGAAYIASNVDATLPMQRGLFIGNGSMVAAVTSATGVVPLSAGKPEPTMFRQAVAHVGARSPLAIGDRLDTDIAGAVAAGTPTLHVLTGVSREFDLIAAPPEYRPTYVAEDLRALLAEEAALLPGPSGGFVASTKGDDVFLSGGDSTADSMAALRTVLALVWKNSQPPTRVRPGSDAAEKAMSRWK